MEFGWVRRMSGRAVVSASSQVKVTQAGASGDGAHC